MGRARGDINPTGRKNLNPIFHLKLITFLLAVSLSFITDASSQTLMWRKLSAPPLTGRADDIYFINAYTGWSVTYSGMIIKTTDGGWTWTVLFDSSGGLFRSIGFLDSMNGFTGTLDSARFLWRTTNGGLNWALVQNFPQPRPVGICGLSVVNNTVIYGCGTYYRAPTVIKSTDAGNTWVSIDMSVYASALVDCYFTSGDSGIVVGNAGSPSRAVILFTSDGGINWVTRITSTDNRALCWKISFPNRNTGYVSIYRSGGPAYFFKTTNAGTSWEQKLFLNSGYYEEAIGFYNDMLGWLEVILI